jgi:hypothetical protein
MICIFTHYVHGYSGNELLPPVVKKYQYAVKMEPGERPDDFGQRMQDLGVAGRQRLSDKPQRPYSCRDGLDWQFIESDPMEIFDLSLLDKDE